MTYRLGALELDENARELRLNGTPVALQPRVFDLLLYLVRNRDRVVPKTELMSVLWTDVSVGDGSLQRAVSLARGALAKGGSGTIRNYPRHGYRFSIDVSEEPLSKHVAAPLAARQAFEREDWKTATDEFASAARDGLLDTSDLEGFAEAALRSGQAALSIEPLEWAIRTYAERDDCRGVARAAAALAQIHLERRELAVAKGWLRRAARALSQEPESREHGLLHWTSSRVALLDGDLERAVSSGEQAHRIGKTLKDPDLEALGLLYWGLALLATGEVRRGLDLQDEAAAAVLGGRVSPWSGGLVYCGVIWSCINRGDFRRATEWTDPFERWCASHRLGSFPGLCRLHRAEVLSLRGELDRAERESVEACGQLAESLPWAEGDAHRVLGDIHLAKGELEKAESSFRRAHELGWEPQPGWAMLLFARGRVDAARSSLERSLNDSNWTNGQRRGALLACFIIVCAQSGATERARAALDELVAYPDLWSTPQYQALVGRARGELALADGEPKEAVSHLRRAAGVYGELEARLLVADVRLRLAEILLASDPEAADLELSSAESAFREAGASARLEHCRKLRASNRS